MRNTTLVGTLLLGLILAPRGARAEAPMCETGSPGSPACAEAFAGHAPAGHAPGVRAPGVHAPAVHAPVDDAEALALQTYSFLMPTGNLLRAGTVSLSAHGLGSLTSLAYGVSDFIELSASAPLVPVLGSVGGRVSLLPLTSNLRVVVGASIWAPLLWSDDEFKYFTKLTGTVAHQTSTYNIHATVARFRSDRPASPAWLLSAGALLKLSPRLALAGNVSLIRLGCAPRCDAPDVIAPTMAGIKYMGEVIDLDLGMAFVRADDTDETLLLPMVSLYRRY